jgi:predicted DNA binding CopG/RHH family protein
MPCTPPKKQLLFPVYNTGPPDANRKTRYRSAPPHVAEAIRSAEIIDDFLPPPGELLPRDETIKVTISLTQKSVEFFKKSAEREGVPYQAMMRRVLDLYAVRYREK